MSYSDKNPAWDRLQKQRADNRAHAEAMTANDLMRADPSLSRADALRQAVEILDDDWCYTAGNPEYEHDLKQFD